MKNTEEMIFTKGKFQNFLNDNTSQGTMMTINDKSRNGQNFPCLTAYFTLGYYTGIFPFRPVYNAKEEMWRLKKWRFQQILVCILLVWTPFWIHHITTVRYHFERFYRYSLTAKWYFILLRAIVNYIKLGLFCWKIHRNSAHIEEHFNCVSASQIHFPSENLVSKRTKRCQTTRKIGIVLLFIYGCIMVIVVGGFFYDPTDTLRHPSISDRYRELIHRGRQRFFMKRGALHKPGEDYSNVDIFLGFVEGYLMFFGYTFVFLEIEIFFFGPFPLTFWMATRNFEDYTSEKLEQAVDWSNRATRDEFQTEMMAAFEEMKTLFGSLNSLWSMLNLFWLFDAALRVIFLLSLAINSKDVVITINTVSQFLAWFGTMYMSGDVYRRMSCIQIKLEDWINHCAQHYGNSGGDLCQVKIIVDELKERTVGIGTAGVYKYNLAFITQILVVVITLFILSFEKDAEWQDQFRKTDKTL